MNKYYTQTELEDSLCAMDSFQPIKHILNGIELHDLQCIDAVKMVVHKRSLLIYSTGCGKTYVASAVMQMLWNKNPSAKFIMFVKKDQLSQTPDKIMRATGKRVITSAAHADDVARILRTDFTKFDILMLTHDCLHNSVILNALFDVRDKYCGIIIDEAHELNNLNHASSAQMLSALVTKFEYCWGLTATPITTNLQQMTKLAALIDPERFSNFKKLALDIQRDPGLLSELKSIFIIREREDFGGKQDYKGRVLWVEPTKAQMQKHFSGVSEMFWTFKGEGADPQINALIIELLEQKQKGKRGLVYINQHKIREHVLPYLSAAGIKYNCINGNTKLDERKEIMYEFNVAKSLDVIITSVTTAVDLDCDYVLFYEFTVNVKQMIGRAHRGLGDKELDVIYEITADSAEIDYFINNIWKRCELTQDVLGQSFAGLDDVRKSVEENYA